MDAVSAASGVLISAASLLVGIFQSTSSITGLRKGTHEAAMALEAEILRVRRWERNRESESQNTNPVTPDEEAARMVEKLVREKLEPLIVMFTKFRWTGEETTSRRLRNSMKWVTKRKEVAKILHLCKELNDTVDSLRQPIAQIANLQEQTQHLTNGQMDLLHRTNALQLEVQSLTRALQESLGVPQQTRDPPLTFDYSPKESGSKIDEDNAAFVEVLYDFALRGLLIIAKLLDRKDVTHLYERLEVWGTGLFDGPLGLVQILAVYPDHTGGSGRGASCGVFQSAFINILLDIGTTAEFWNL